MRRILNSRFFRLLICLVLICCILVNSSPIKAEAVIAELTAAQLLKWGIVAMVTLMTCGVFFQIQNEYELQDLGRTYYNHAHAAASAAERLDDLEVMNEVIGEAVDNKIIYFGGSGHLPDGFWKLLFSITTISLLDVFLKNEDGYFEAHYPSSGTLSNGDTLVHNGVTYTITSASAPVFFFTQCTENACQTVVCSSAKFTWSRDVSTTATLKQPSSLTIDNVYMYCAIDALGRDGFGTSCYPCTDKWTVAALRSRAAGIVGTGSPSYNISPSLIEGDLQEDYELVGDTHTLEIPDIDFSSMGSNQDIIDTANKIINGEMTYEDLLNQFSSGVAPSVVPNTSVNPDPGTGTNPDVDPNPGTNSGSSSWTPPSDMGKFTLDLKQYFPFCIPFDLYAFFTCLNAEPVAPVIEWIIPLPGGKTYPFEIDLSAFDSVAQILRRMQLLLFCVGLAFKTRDLIKG